MKKISLILICTVGLASCAVGGPPNPTALQRVQFGAQPTQEDAIRKIQSYLAETLIDPDSLKLSCSNVSGKAWIRGNPFDEPKYGYLVFCTVNAKNRLGGYTGAKPQTFLFNGSAFLPIFEEYMRPGRDYGSIE